MPALTDNYCVCTPVDVEASDCLLLSHLANFVVRQSYKPAKLLDNTQRNRINDARCDVPAATPVGTHRIIDAAPELLGRNIKLISQDMRPHRVAILGHVDWPRDASARTCARRTELIRRSDGAGLCLPWSPAPASTYRCNRRCRGLYDCQAGTSSLLRSHQPFLELLVCRELDELHKVGVRLMIYRRMQMVLPIQGVSRIAETSSSTAASKSSSSTAIGSPGKNMAHLPFCRATCGSCGRMT